MGVICWISRSPLKGNCVEVTVATAKALRRYIVCVCVLGGGLVGLSWAQGEEYIWVARQVPTLRLLCCCSRKS